MTIVKNIKDAYGTSDVSQDSASLVEYLLITVAVAVTAIIVIGWIMTAVSNKGADIGECIEGSNAWDPNASSEKCKNADHSKDNSFKKDSGYTNRYGN